MKKEEFHRIAPILGEISQEKSPFKVPENYFKQIEDAVFTELSAEKIQPIKNTSVFKTPENYFNTVEDVVLTKLKAEALQSNTHKEIPDNYFETLENIVFNKIKSNKKVFLLKNSLKYITPIAVAASLLLIFVLNSKPENVSFESLATSEIEQFIEIDLINIDSESLAMAFHDIELSTNDFTISASNTEVLDYLTNEDLETILYEN